ncbi:MAG: feruloyl-CoA synthase [Sulfuritalea sp.]|nr:feruloyl-CoA synthase [Sulfuritalea sp.]
MNQESSSMLKGFAPAAVISEKRGDGSILLSCPRSLGPYARCVGEYLEHWAQAAPDRVFLAERQGPDWRRLTYAGVLAAVRAIGASLLQRGLSVDRPLVILSDNSVNHALLMLGAMHVGVPVAPVSPAYSVMSRDHVKLRFILDQINPGLIYACDGARFAPAMRAVDMHGALLVTDSGEAQDGLPIISFGELLATPGGAEVDRAFAAVGPDSIAKILFTSGSTGVPKGVVNTQRMLCSNQQAIVQNWPFLEARPPVVVDWLPWNHTFGGNHNFNMILKNGGTLYVDEGKPAPGLIEKTVANLRDVSPTMYFNVPRGFDMLIPYLERDDALRKRFFADLDMIFYAAAALPQNLWRRLEELSVQERGHATVMLSAWGATETAPMITNVHFKIDRAGVIGLPAPGCEIKMVPNATKMELRVRGPNVMPGYWKEPELTKAAFDEEGFYLMGDAGRFADPLDHAKGIEFDGRIAEDFKLMSGVWVHVGALRIHALSLLAPVAQDIVVAGHDREAVGFLIFANPAGCRSLCPDLAADAPLAQVLADPRVVAHVRAGMVRLVAEGGGSSMVADRAVLMDEPASIDAGEITDKGYINQRAVLTRRAALVDRLYAGMPADGVILRPTSA